MSHLHLTTHSGDQSHSSIHNTALHDVHPSHDAHSQHHHAHGGPHGHSSGDHSHHTTTTVAATAAALSAAEIATAWMRNVSTGVSDASSRSVLEVKRTCYYFRLLLAFMGVHSPPYRAESYHFAPLPKWSLVCPRRRATDATLDCCGCYRCCCDCNHPCDCCRGRHNFEPLTHEQRMARCDRWCWPTSFVLMIALLLVGLVFGPALDLIGLDTLAVIKSDSPRFCVFPEGTLSSYEQIMLNLTSLPEGKINATAMFHLANESYWRGFGAHPALINVSTGWPQPLQWGMPGQQQQIDNDLHKTCLVQKCKWGINLWVNCLELEVPCPDPGALFAATQNTIISSTMSPVPALNQTVQDILNQTSLPSTDVRDQVVDQLFILFNRIQWGVTLYVFYLGLRIFIGDPYHMAQPSIPSKCLSILGGATKPMWVLLFVMGWYISEIIVQYLSIPDVQLFWFNVRIEPCWLDRHFVAEFYGMIQNICAQTVFYRNQFNAAIANYQYFQQVDFTYVYRDGVPGLVYLPHINLNETVYTSTCNPTTVLPLVLSMPHVSSVNWWYIVFESGVLMALFLEPFLAHWLVSLFEVIAPLTSSNGRVLLPMDSLLEVFNKQNDLHEAARSRIATFSRASHLLPLLFWTAGLFVLIATHWSFFYVAH